MENFSLILVTGASGLLGWSFLSAARRRNQSAIGLFHTHPLPEAHADSICIDLTDHSKTHELLNSIRPNWVVHCAAMTNVDLCEAEPDKARLLNSTVSGNLAKEARNLGAGFIYISTDSIFDGVKGDYAEEDLPHPINVYAQSKLAGERAVLDEFPNTLIVRTNIYGWNVQNKLSLAEWILSRLESNTSIPGFHDVIFNPLLVNDLSDILLMMMNRGMKGLYHVAGSDTCNKYEFALSLADVFGLDGRLIKKASIDDSVLKAPRPRNTSLNHSKIERDLGIRMPDLISGLQHFKSLRTLPHASEANRGN